MSFTIKSYLKHTHRDIRNLNDVEKRPLYYFIDINNTKEILLIKNNLDHYYIYGAICLTYNQQIIMDFTYYDLIDQLWGYFLNMIEEFLEKKKSEMSFPDQPLPISMHKLSDEYILFSVGFAEWTLPKYEFFNALLTGAKDFFEKMMLLVEENNNYHIYALKKIKNLENKISDLKR